LEKAGEPAFRSRQILEWIYKKFESDPERMTNLPAKTKKWLKENFILTPSQRQLVKGDPDATRKLLLKMGDGALIETVLIKAPRADEGDSEDDSMGEHKNESSLSPTPYSRPQGGEYMRGLRPPHPDINTDIETEYDNKWLTPLEPLSADNVPIFPTVGATSLVPEGQPNVSHRFQPVAGIGTRKTVCISTQVGCAYGCKFCASGMLGWRRDLLAGEIVGEIMEVISSTGEENSTLRPPAGRLYQLTDYIDNIVVMGMGEPLSNFDNLMTALTIVNAPWGLNFGARRITVSTSGVVPKIRELAELPAQFRLAISLHGATNEVRDQIMPVNKKYPLEELIPAARYYNEKHNRMLTFEYILIDGLNDTYEQAEALIKLCDGLKVHINCIPYNKVEGLPWKRPSIMRQQAFTRKLRDANISVTVRHEKGNRIDAACGQLRLREEKKLSQGSN
jgi:23S rRNA (adenine2503-C2)-methyltransferase